MARKRQLIVGLAVAAAAVGAPIGIAFSTPDASVTQAQPGCTAWFGSKADGKCIAWSMGSGRDTSLNGIPVTINGPTGDPGTDNSSTIMGGRGSGLN
ncbi:hypothetical protein [Mycobacterium sp. ACS4331]|uniref:DUF7155 family protein n=1 Tax=Mycobacterium sp. ACS4331 TaxID=1834121 RepID=UPI0007FD6316|nr:hypothetical protein [Mycobacterium sp. ACS4331]OBF30438.1 hypothetical protein A5727_00030 [Mycobacterium sp. ACS4331]